MGVIWVMDWTMETAWKTPKLTWKRTQAWRPWPIPRPCNERRGKDIHSCRNEIRQDEEQRAEMDGRCDAYAGFGGDNWDVCMKRWENIIGWYRKVLDQEESSGLQSFFTLTPKRYKFQMDRRLYDATHGMQHGSQTAHPPNLLGTGAPKQQGGGGRKARGGVGGETSASENCEGAVGDGYRSRLSSGGKMTKRKNARQHAFEAITEVMHAHSKVVAESIDRASKRQCDVLQRQCDIMEREVK
ncbi:hypothetical protein CBR_g32009 [Chara braunii]|uniref:Myb-like domain-containing protein n=1 Tax=Chara braunii TaxID=69332 RepID=A0A388LG86_CHABU|nr:hypothetical protein CBR_g32009 [Chara braunii]|eukprot:GBG81335.1 hypothetical protein CBR_g32009 [Chara braunii]